MYTKFASLAINLKEGVGFQNLAAAIVSKLIIKDIFWWLSMNLFSYHDPKNNIKIGHALLIIRKIAA